MLLDVSVGDRCFHCDPWTGSDPVADWQIGIRVSEGGRVLLVPCSWSNFLLIAVMSSSNGHSGAWFIYKHVTWANPHFRRSSRAQMTNHSPTALTRSLICLQRHRQSWNSTAGRCVVCEAVVLTPAGRVCDFTRSHPIALVGFMLPHEFCSLAMSISGHSAVVTVLVLSVWKSWIQLMMPLWWQRLHECEGCPSLVWKTRCVNRAGYQWTELQVDFHRCTRMSWAGWVRLWWLHLILELDVAWQGDTQTTRW